MNLKQLVEDIKRQRNYASDTLEDATDKTINARRSRKASAASRLEELLYDYRQMVRPLVMPLIVTGDQAQEFADLAKSGPASLDGINSNDLYTTIVDSMNQELLTRGENNTYIIEAASSILENVAIDMGVRSMPQIVYNQKYSGKTNNREEALALVQRVIDEQVGQELQSLHVLSKASKIAFNEEFDGKFFPYIVVAKTEMDLKNILSSLTLTKNKSIVISTGTKKIKSDFSVEEVNEDSVLEVLKKVKNKTK